MSLIIIFVSTENESKKKNFLLCIMFYITFLVLSYFQSIRNITMLFSEIYTVIRILYIFIYDPKKDNNEKMNNDFLEKMENRRNQEKASNENNQSIENRGNKENNQKIEKNDNEESRNNMNNNSADLINAIPVFGLVFAGIKGLTHVMDDLRRTARQNKQHQ